MREFHKNKYYSRLLKEKIATKPKISFFHEKKQQTTKLAADQTGNCVREEVDQSGKYQR